MGDINFSELKNPSNSRHGSLKLLGFLIFKLTDIEIHFKIN